LQYPSDPQWELFRAVHEGDVRVRYHGRDLTGEERWLLLHKRHSDDVLGDPWALPCDIEVSVEDIRRIWNDETCPLRKRGKRGPERGKVGLVENITLDPEIKRIMSEQNIDSTKAARILVKQGKVASQGGSPESVAKHLAAGYRKRSRSE
jgi:hypothetical protein